MERDGPADAFIELSATRERFESAVRRGDATQAVAVYARDATLLPPSAGLVSGRTAIERFWQAGIDSGISEVAFEPMTAAGTGTLAYEIGSYSLRLRTADRGTVVERGKYVLVLEQQGDGSWRRAVEMFSPGSPPVRSTRGTSDLRKEES